MEDLLNKLGELLLGRVEGPLHFRLLLQPAMAIFFAFRDGIKDAKAGRTPYFWSLFTEPDKRAKKIREGWKSVSKVFLLAFFLDLAYQFLELPRLYPFHALMVAVYLAIIPYLLLRGLVTRIWRRQGTSEKKGE
ncbi:MAG: hypothetical protein H6Q65_2738 [Firmicutes bacterium]|nr:hypothetical protein [Bacillota bacterium]